MKNIVNYLNVKNRRILSLTTMASVWLLSYWLFPTNFRELIEPRAQAATFTVTNTNNSGAGSLRLAIVDANNNSGADTIAFNIPPTDARHFYYQNNGIAGTVSQSMIAATTAADDTTIPDIDPDWAHSWFSISTEGMRLDSNGQLTINGYTQPGAIANTSANGGLNTVLKIEVTNGAVAGNIIFNTFSATHTIRGLIVNRGSTGIAFDIGNNGSVAAGNFLGTDPSGTIGLGNSARGIEVQRSDAATIGGIAPADRNLISGNYVGVLIAGGSGAGDAPTTNTLVTGNLIGTTRNGVSPLGNGFIFQPTLPNNGISISAVAATNNTNRIENNTIAFNAKHGIGIGGGGVGTSAVLFGNRLTGNSIFSNGALGIRLNSAASGDINPTLNDACDTDNGPNTVQNYPVLGAAVPAGNNLNISGTLDSTAGSTFTIHFYSNPSPDASGHGEGKTFLGATTATDSDNNCLSNFSASIPRPTSAETFITATATDALNNTSEFSRVFRIANAPFDFDGDLKTDISVFRPAVGEWWLSRSSTAQTIAAQFGASSDRITPADFTGDGKTDIAFWRTSTGEWFILRSEDGTFFSFPFGAPGDLPVPADYDGDGKTDTAVFRPSTSTWFVLNSSGGGTAIFQFGQTGDVPVPADYDGDGKPDVAIWRPNGVTGAEWWYVKSSNGQAAAVQFGNSTDKPVPNDFTGDGKTDIAFWRPSNGFWFILRSEDFSFYSVPFGANGDLPVAGDYDGDGRSDTAVFRPSSSTWFISRSTAGTLIAQFGVLSDRPIPNAFIP